MLQKTFRTLPVLAALALAACGDSTGPGQEQELITRVTLTLTPTNGPGGLVEVFIDDPDGLGPLPPSAQSDNLFLYSNVTYEGSIRFENRLVSPPEDITEEVAAEADEHGVIYTASSSFGSVVTTDTDGMGKFLGLTFRFTPGDTGPGTLRAILCHYADVTKPETATSCAGDTDVDVTFNYEADFNTLRAPR